MNKIIKAAIFVMAIMMSATFAFGQGTTDIDNNDLQLNNKAGCTTLALNVEIPTTTMASMVTATISWYFNGTLITECYSHSVQSQEGVFVGNYKFDFLQFSAPTACLRTGVACVKYVVKAINDVAYPAQTVNIANGTFNIAPESNNILNITPSMWCGPQGCAWNW